MLASVLVRDRESIGFGREKNVLSLFYDHTHNFFKHFKNFLKY